MIDARETAPRGVIEAQYFDAEGRPVRGATVRGGTATAIPGVPAALVHIAQRYARLRLIDTLSPAVRLAREGFEVDARYARIAKIRETFLRAGTNTGVFLDGGAAPRAGFVLKQPDLADTLERIAREGAAGFYEGQVARALVATVQKAGGAWTLEDLARYRVIEREPIRFAYKGARITAAALPSAGGIAIAQALAMLEHVPMGRVGHAETDHLVIEALRRAFHDRARYLADPDFVRVPLARLLSADYARDRASGIDATRATQSDTVDALAGSRGSGNTTHFSIIDAAGNRVAATLTINLLFGSGIVGAGTGVLLNNEMDDFTLRPDVPNAFGLRGGSANRIEPGKRPLSSMTPTFVEDAKGVLVLGSPGGSRIVSQVLLAILGYVDSAEVDLHRLVRMPRYHHQYLPDRVEIEPQGFTQEWRAAIAGKGHAIQAANRAWGNMQIVFRSTADGAAQAASDPRGLDIGWY
jgi:gamma-glutamyltranspeptidase/glutathione hydrolase